MPITLVSKHSSPQFELKYNNENGGSFPCYGVCFMVLLWNSTYHSGINVSFEYLLRNDTDIRDCKGF